MVVISGFCAAVVAGIGFAGSYNALRDLARLHGFGAYSYVFPIGIDAGIIAMYGLDLVLVARRMPKPLLRLVAHILTLATIVFNAASGQKPVKDDPLGAVMHGVLPLLFVAVVEATRHLIIRTNRLVLSAESDTIPLHRWALAPWKTWALFRRMKLWDIASYAQMAAMEQERTVYRAWLQHQYGRQWKKKAGATAMLPFTLAPFGLGVDEALDLPRKQQEDADRRQDAEQARIAAASEREELRVLEREERQADASIRRMGIGAKVSAAEHHIAAQTATAETEAHAAEASARVAAEAAEKTAVLSAESTLRLAERQAAEAERQAVEAERLAAEAERESVEAERAAIRTERAEKTAAEAEAEARADAARLRSEEDRLRRVHVEAEAAREAAAMQTAETERAEAVARQAEAEKRTALAREAVARAELAAQEADDAARLSPRERGERQVARMILAAHHALPEYERPIEPDMYAVTLEDIGSALNVARTAASERRQAAADLIKSGYAG
ncbi:DUF2637 domain-containing protein [Streptomyces sp. TX20-6-3]|uniref:DUF2637 domain-containing protein n=1 Tax=Streptomyces sp. TX20-6-3 TaxID=3028705 RepID=UPI0029B03F25|nr:DUF2637 domain-containing protein [Streptomyces sp. TX20-6-3]MDX2565005.1 DUF2637 domain-containing protein [Streptomyces sp. TX20-6-3]